MMVHCLTYYFKPDEAWLLCYLANMERTSIKLPQKYRKAGWFYCTGKKLGLDLGLSKDKQKLVIRKLKEHGFIDSVRKYRVDEDGALLGNYPVRWVRLNHAAINAAVLGKIEEAAD